MKIFSRTLALALLGLASVFISLGAQAATPITNAFFAGAQTAPPKRGAAGGSPVITTANPIGAAR